MLVVLGERPSAPIEVFQSREIDDGMILCLKTKDLEFDRWIVGFVPWDFGFGDRRIQGNSFYRWSSAAIYETAMRWFNHGPTGTSYGDATCFVHFPLRWVE